MTPVLHTLRPPQVPGCHGRSPKRYAAGRVCKSCTTVLRTTNPGPYCGPCEDNSRRGSPASAGSTAATKAAPAIRDNRGRDVSAADVLALLVTGEYVSGTVIGTELGITRCAVWKHVKNLRALGWHIEAVPRRGMFLVDEKPEDAPASSPAPAPVTPPGHLADMAPASDPLRGPVPFAWVAAMGWIDPDDETEALEICLRQLGRLDRHARDRVMIYLAIRFIVDWPDKEA